MTREEAIEWIEYHIDISDYDEDDVLLTALEMAVKALKKQMTGHWWINPDGYAPYCSECKRDSDRASAYCPNCGAKMEGVK